jgi:hypothetical protein
MGRFTRAEGVKIYCAEPSQLILKVKSEASWGGLSRKIEFINSDMLVCPSVRPQTIRDTEDLCLYTVYIIQYILYLYILYIYKWSSLLEHEKSIFL